MVGPGPLNLRVASRTVPLHEGEPCGDAAACFELPVAADGASRRLLAIVDGLGHGPEAALAAQAALDVLAGAPDQPLAVLFASLDARLLATRGAAIGLVQVDGLRLRHAGIGNTRAIRFPGGSGGSPDGHVHGGPAARLPSCNGIVGAGSPLKVTVTEVTLAPGDWLVMFTDGLNEMVQLPVRLPEWERDPATLCDHLLQRWRQGRDDAGVLVAQMAPPEAG